MKILGSLLVLATIGLGVPVFAAEPNNVAKLTDAGGTVMVDRGKGFVTTSVNAPLFENDRVITLDGSMAEITFTDGCRTKLKSNNLIVISIDPGCKAAILDATQGTAPGTQVASTHWGNYIPPVAGALIIIHAISYETNGFGAFDHRRGFKN